MVIHPQARTTPRLRAEIKAQHDPNLLWSPSTRPGCKCVFDLVIDFGTSQSPKSTRPLTAYSCPSRPGHPALRNNFASSLLLRIWLPYDWMPPEAYFVFPLAQGTPGKQCDLAATGDYQPSLRSPWLAASGWQRRKT